MVREISLQWHVIVLYRRRNSCLSLSTRIDLKGIMLCEIGQRMAKYCMISFIRVYKMQTQRNRIEWWLQGAGDWGNEDLLVKGYKVLLRRYVSSGDIMYSMVIIVRNIVYLKVAKGYVLNTLTPKRNGSYVT